MPQPKRDDLPEGMHLSTDGYLRIHRLPLRMRYAHREYASRCVRESWGRELFPGEVVHHCCGNKLCWPPTDFHLLITSKAIHDAMDAGATPTRKHRARGPQQRIFSGDEDYA